MYTKEEINDLVAGLKKIELSPGKIFHIKKGHLHRIESIEDLTIIESSSVEVDDVFRLQDDTEREHGRIKNEHPSN